MAMGHSSLSGHTNEDRAVNTLWVWVRFAPGRPWHKGCVRDGKLNALVHCGARVKDFSTVQVVGRDLSKGAQVCEKCNDSTP